MRDKSQTSQAQKISRQILVPLVIFIIGGLVIPIYAAPYLYSLLPVDPYATNNSSTTLSLRNRNLVSGEVFRVKASRPSEKVSITSLQYPCQSGGVRIFYFQAGKDQQLPCDVRVRLPKRQQHSLLVQTDRSQLNYIPVTVKVQSQSAATTTTFSIATANSLINDRSSLTDKATKTISF